MNGRCSDSEIVCLEGVVLSFDVIKDGWFGVVSRWDVFGCLNSDDYVEVDGMVMVAYWRSVFKMCVVEDLLVIAVTDVWAGVVFGHLSFWLVAGVELVVFIVECVAVVVIVDNGWETLETMVDVMVFVECWYLVWLIDGLSTSLSIMEYGLVVSNLLQDPDLDQVPEGWCWTHFPKFCRAVCYSSGCLWLAKKLGWIMAWQIFVWWIVFVCVCMVHVCVCQVVYRKRCNMFEYLQFVIWP